MTMRDCKLTECKGKPRCANCLAMDAAYPIPVVNANVVPGATGYSIDAVRSAYAAGVTAERKRWLHAVAWALGTNGDFSPPNSIEPYWWRHELAERCGIFWNGERWIDRPNVRIEAGPTAAQEHEDGTR